MLKTLFHRTITKNCISVEQSRCRMKVDATTGEAVVFPAQNVNNSNWYLIHTLEFVYRQQLSETPWIVSNVTFPKVQTTPR